MRLEVEVKSRDGQRYLPEADAELRQLFDGRPGKLKELCRRLYPERLAA